MRLLHEPTFWFAVIFVGIIVGIIGSLLASYLRNALDLLTARFSARSNARKTKRQRESEELISALIENPLLFHAYTTNLLYVTLFRITFFLLSISVYVIYFFISSKLTILEQILFLLIMFLFALLMIATGRGGEMPLPDFRIILAIYKRQRQNRSGEI